MTYLHTWQLRRHVEGDVIYLLKEDLHVRK